MITQGQEIWCLIFVLIAGSSLAPAAKTLQTRDISLDRGLNVNQIVTDICITQCTEKCGNRKLFHTTALLDCI